MKYFFILILTSLWSVGLSQEEYAFDEVLEYDYVDIKKQKKWKWMQLHNSQDNSYQASVHVQDSSVYWFNLTFSNKPKHARFKIDNYILADSYTVLVNETNLHHSNLPKGTRVISNYTKQNFKFEQIDDKDDSTIRFEVKPKNNRVRKRYKLRSFYYEIDVSKQNHKVNFIRDYVKRFFKKKTGLTSGIITKRCIKNVDGEIINCINLKEVHKLKSRVIIED